MTEQATEDKNEHRREASTVERLVIPQIECCKCGWIGDEIDMKKVPSPSLKKLGVKGNDNVCPKCEHDEFYRV